VYSQDEDEQKLFSAETFSEEAKFAKQKGWDRSAD
jgi:hypothetical protein